MSWALLNLPLAGLIFLAVAGIPLWIVIRHPDAGPRPAAGLAARAGRLAVVPAARAGMGSRTGQRGSLVEQRPA